MLLCVIWPVLGQDGMPFRGSLTCEGASDCFGVNIPMWAICPCEQGQPQFRPLEKHVSDEVGGMLGRRNLRQFR